VKRDGGVAARHFMNDAIEKSFQAALRLVMESDSNLTQAVVGEMSGYHGNHIGKILRGEGIGSEKARRKIAAALGYSYEEFLEMGERGELKKSKEDEERGKTVSGEPQEQIIVLYSQMIEDLKRDKEELRGELKKMRAEKDDWKMLANTLLNKGIRPPADDDRDDQKKASFFEKG